ncbi:MAG: phage/plasmid primase, P4 family [Phycisphaerae bacterium]|jgi:putative DNA primase/helicase
MPEVCDIPALATLPPQELREASVRHGHELGWSFTPLAGKRPTLKAWQDRPRESLEETLVWAAKGNIGLRTGQTSGVVVIDADEGANLQGLELPGTVTASTGGNGIHLYFRCSLPLGNSSGKLGPHIDVKADGGQVVFPGSIHPDTGRLYRWATGLSPWETELAELPEHIIDLLTAPPAPARSSSAPRSSSTRQAKTPHERYATMALRLELNALYQAQEGTRNDTLNRSAFNLGTLIGGGFLDRTDVEQALLEAAIAVGLGQHEAEATIRSGIESGIKHPRQVQTREQAANQVEPQPQAIPTLPPGQFKLDLYGNADRFMHLFGPDVHWCEERGKWFVWEGRCWKTDAIREVSHLAEVAMRALVREAAGDEDAMKWATRCNKDAKPAREMLEVVKHRSAIALSALDKQPWLLGVDNGVVDLRTGELLPHDRQHLITTLSPASYDPDAPCPRWEQFMGEIMAGNVEMVAALQRLAGYFLTGDISVQILPIFYGPGGNGKNVFLDTIMGVMGPHAEEAPDGLVTAKASEEHPTEIADLYGKRLVVASETEENKKLRIGLVKKITGNKFLKGRFMRQDYFQFERTHKTVLVTNNKPVVTESSNAIWRRLRLIPFVVTIPEDQQDRQLTERLVAEWPGILAWAVRGCLEWQARQCDLEFPQAVREATEEYRNDSDHVADFLAECCEDWRRHPQQNMRTPKERVYLAYCNWCRNVGEDVLTRNALNSRLRQQGFEDKPLRADGRLQKCWMHMTFRGEDHE